MSVDWSDFDAETVVIDRRADTSNPVLKTYTVIYSGTCDFQSKTGSQYRNPAGVVDIADATLDIDPDSSGNLPAVKVGDRATVTQNGVATVFNVDNVGVWNFEPVHIELVLKRGPETLKPGR